MPKRNGLMANDGLLANDCRLMVKNWYEVIEKRYVTKKKVKMI